MASAPNNRATFHEIHDTPSGRTSMPTETNPNVKPSSPADNRNTRRIILRNRSSGNWQPMLNRTSAMASWPIGSSG